MKRTEIEGFSALSGICGAKNIRHKFLSVLMNITRIVSRCRYFFASKYPVTATLRHPDSSFLHIQINFWGGNAQRKWIWSYAVTSRYWGPVQMSSGWRNLDLCWFPLKLSAPIRPDLKYHSCKPCLLFCTNSCQEIKGCLMLYSFLWLVCLVNVQRTKKFAKDFGWV